MFSLQVPEELQFLARKIMRKKATYFLFSPHFSFTFVFFITLSKYCLIVKNKISYFRISIQTAAQPRASTVESLPYSRNTALQGRQTTLTLPGVQPNCEVFFPIYFHLQSEGSVGQVETSKTPKGCKTAFLR